MAAHFAPTRPEIFDTHTQSASPGIGLCK